MSDKFPDRIDPLVFAERRGTVAGQLALAQFERLSDYLVERDGAVDVRLEFDKEGKRVVLSGQIAGTVQLECQSCLQGVAWPLDIRFKLAVVATPTEAERLEDYEPIVLDDDKISLHAVVEDEILLAIPDFPRHEHRCLERNSSSDNDYTDSRTKADNPFSVLAKLKKTGD